MDDLDQHCWVLEPTRPSRESRWHTRTHARTHTYAHTHAPTHAPTHPRTRARTHTHKRAHISSHLISSHFISSHLISSPQLTSFSQIRAQATWRCDGAAGTDISVTYRLHAHRRHGDATVCHRQPLLHSAAGRPCFAGNLCPKSYTLHTTHYTLNPTP